ncbi:MAG: hypothetical protein AAGC65_14835 [Mucilaginibacter sp.]|uniref:hypothetical protein n=1 Tax=Mucilaginibacter sp. TaxID=1882438 RepID=UPI0031A28B89
MDLGNYLSLLLIGTFHSLNRVFLIALANTEINDNYQVILALFLSGGDSSVAQLSQHLNMFGEELAQALNQLENEGYIGRWQNTTGRKDIIIHLTEKVRLLQSQLEEIIETIEQTGFTGIDKDDINKF